MPIPVLQNTGPSPDQPLPCHPCPHKGACCKHGASLTGEEVSAIEDEYGESAVSYDPDLGSDDPYRTKLQPHPIHGEACVFLTSEGACLIHDKPYFPKTCRGFPWLTDEGKPYVHDKTICPEFVQINEPRKKD